MTFASPWAFSLLLLALPVIGLYILKVRLRRVHVSTNLFWKQVYEEKPPRSLWQQFRHRTSLLMQLLILLLLTLAIADPSLSGAVLQSRRLVVILDQSASMRAADVAPSRLDAAKQEALRLIESLRFRDEMAVIAAGSHPEVILGMTGHSASLREAVRQVRQLDVPGALDDAVELAQRIVGDHPHGHVLVLTDGCQPGLPFSDSRPSPGSRLPEPDPGPDPGQLVSEPAEPRQADDSVRPVIEYRLFADRTREPTNIGITQLQTRRSFTDPIGYEILISVRNASSEFVACRLELLLNGIPVDIIPLKLKPEEHWHRSVEKTSLEGGAVVASLTGITFSGTDPVPSESTDTGESTESATSGSISSSADLLSADNTAWAILPERRVQTIQVITSTNLFLQKVFEASPLVELTMRKELPSDFSSADITVLHGNVPQILPAGNVMVINPSSDCDAWTLGRLIRDPIISEQNSESPLMTHIRLDNVQVPETRLLEFRYPVRALARSAEGDILYAEVQRANGKCLVLSVDLENSDLAFRTAFPILISNAMSWFAGDSGLWNPAIRAGSTAQVPLSFLSPGTPSVRIQQPNAGSRDLPEAVSDQTRRISLRLTSPTGAASTMEILNRPDDSPTATIGPLSEIGIWSVQIGTGSEKSLRSGGIAARVPDRTPESPGWSVAVNLASELETDIRPVSEPNESVGTSTIPVGWLTRPLWFYLTLLLCALICAEWILYHRRLIA